MAALIGATLNGVSTCFVLSECQSMCFAVPHSLTSCKSVPQAKQCLQQLFRRPQAIPDFKVSMRKAVSASNYSGACFCTIDCSWWPNFPHSPGINKRRVAVKSGLVLCGVVATNAFGSRAVEDTSNAAAACVWLVGLQTYKKVMECVSSSFHVCYSHVFKCFPTWHHKLACLWLLCFPICFIAFPYML